ncbi:MAG: RDD family protein, partial [Acidimicrobiales bacterium]|nr:RDD family protein [Acidimicrobiales bacterium]
VLDLLIVGIPSGSLSSFVMKVLPKEPGTCEKLDGTTYACDVLTRDSEGIHGSLLQALLLFVVFFYFGRLEGRRGGTPGKRIAKLKVVDATTGAPIGMGRAIGRWIMRFASAIPLWLGYLWMLWDDDNQTWHDKVVRSRVVRA